MLGLLAPSFTSRQEDMPGRYTQVLETGVPTLAMPTTPPRDRGAGSARSTLLWAWDGLKGATRLIGDAYAATSNAISTTMGLSVASMDEEPLPSDEDYEFIEDPDAEEMDRLNGSFLPSVLNMPGYRRVAVDGSEEYYVAEETRVDEECRDGSDPGGW